ncbi:MAG TPA: hypothetical protein VLM80_12835 [Anaerolineales bacterium]|nr:hypothetical protein [Anaerolineales bacterium]
MTVRSFDWRDLPTLVRYREDSVFLDSVLVLTRGSFIVPGALLSYLAPAMGVFTCVSTDDDDQGLVGQFMHVTGSPFAHLTFLTPYSALEMAGAPALLDYMVQMSGERGAWRLLADVDEQSLAFESLRMNSFAINARQRIWKISDQVQKNSARDLWQTATSQDLIAIRGLYNNLVPALVQQAEPFTMQRPRGVVHYHQGELLAYVEFKFGHRGVWAQPFVHPDTEDVSGLMIELLQKIPNQRTRPVYICVRSYQAWLEPILEELGAEAGPRQAVMVKHLVQQQKAGRVFSLPTLETGQPKASTPMVHSKNR